MNDSIILYLIINSSLNMSIGKCAAQAGHAVGMIYESIDELTNSYLDHKHTGKLSIDELSELASKINLFSDWQNSSYTKVVLAADSKEWEKIKLEFKNNMCLVKDAGRTELEPGSETCIALFPQFKSRISKTIKRLQLLK